MEKWGLFSPFALPGLLRHGRSRCAASVLVGSPEEADERSHNPPSGSDNAKKNKNKKRERFVLTKQFGALFLHSEHPCK